MIVVNYGGTQILLYALCDTLQIIVIVEKTIKMLYDPYRKYFISFQNAVLLLSVAGL